MDDPQNQDICRVCRCEGTTDRPLFHPCICTGSIKFIHQDCLVQWLRYSKKEYCELCKHRFSFTPIYSPDMPKRLPIKDLLSGLARSMVKAIKCWLHYTLVAFAWLALVPLTACRIYKCLFTGSVSSLFTLPLDLLSSENIPGDISNGLIVVGCTLSAFFCLVWLREQIIHGGGPDWIERELNEEGNAVDQNQEENAENVEEPLHEPPAAALVVANNNNGDMGDDNWNPIEWDRAEELTWERLLGLDGSLAFLEHVFWVISLNTMFIVIFAFCPYHIGYYALVAMKVRDNLQSTQFEGLLTTILGYFVVGFSFFILHAVTNKINSSKAKKICGLCYIVVKVFLLTVVEVGVFPLIGGWWLDICSLTLFDSTLKDRMSSLHAAPGTVMFLHWLVGMVYVFYFATAILLLREVVRPGTLWFLRNINDPDFNPIHEMIHLPLIRHTRRFIASLVIFGSTVLLLVYLPINMINFIFPNFLPYYITLFSEAPMIELTMELLLLNVVLPALIEQGHTRVWLKQIIKYWCIGVSFILDIRSYLLGDVPLDSKRGEVIRLQGVNEDGDNQQREAAEPPAEEALVNGGLGAAHQAIMERHGPTGFQPYIRPKWFTVRILALILIMCISLIFASATVLTVPVFVGRNALALITSTAIHEIYTVGVGLYLCMFAVRFLTVAFSWLALGWNQLITKVKYFIDKGSRAILVMAVVAALIPILLGILIELTIRIPFRVPLHQTPIPYVWLNWALGVLYMKIVCACIMMGPNWWLKSNLEEIYSNGLRNVNLDLVLRRTAFPVANVLAMSIAVPYIISQSFIPFFVSYIAAMHVERRIYPILTAVAFIGSLIRLQLAQFKRMYEHIRNDKYLVGKRLVNYNHRSEQCV